MPEKLLLPHGSSTLTLEVVSGSVRVEAEVLNFHIGKNQRMVVEVSL